MREKKQRRTGPGRRRRGALLALSLLALPGRAGADEGPPPPPMRFGAWITYWDFERGLAAVTQPRSTLDEVFLFAAHLTPDGTPVLANPRIDHRRAARRLRGRGLRVWLTVVNDVVGAEPGQRKLKDREVVRALLADPARQRAHRRQLRDLATSLGCSGVDVDYENLHVEDRSAFTSFVREAAREMRQAGLALSVTVQPKVRESSSQGPGAMDWTGLCAHASRLQIMLYNLHNRRTAPGPMATPGWVREVLRYAREECPAERIVPVLKVSGMDWGGGDAKAIHFEEATQLRTAHGGDPRRDPDGGVPWFHYAAGSGRHTVYFEDARSLEQKIEAVASSGLERVVFWSLGRHDPALFDTLRQRWGRVSR